MSGTVRALRFATWRAVRVVGITLIMSVGFIFYFMLLEGTPFYHEYIIARFPQMVLFVGSFMYVAYGVVDIATYVQYAMSCGCTRKNTLISAVYMHVVEIAGAELALFIYFLIVPEGWLTVNRSICRTALVTYVFAAGISLVMGILVKRFGRLAYILFIVCFAIFGGVIGGLAGYFGSDVFAFMIPGMNPLLPVAVFVWYGLMTAVFWLFIRKMEVRV